MARDSPTVILRKAHEGIVENPKDKAHRSAASRRGQDLTKPPGGLCHMRTPPVGKSFYECVCNTVGCGHVGMDGPASPGFRMIARSAAIAMMEASYANSSNRAGFGQERLSGSWHRRFGTGRCQTKAQTLGGAAVLCRTGHG